MPNTSDIIFDTIDKWGVDTIFGLPGDGINGLMEALRKRQDKIRFVLVRHEEAAAFMATSYAKLTGKPGVCIATTGPGGIHLLNGLYDAKMDNAPVVAITGTTYTDLAGSEYQQDVNLVRLMEDVAEYDVQVNSPEHASMATDLAFRTALARRGVAHITVPIDVQIKEHTGKLTKHRVKGETTQTPGFHPSIPPKETLQAAAEILNEADKPVILAGSGAREAASRVVELAEHVQAPVVKALLGKDIIPDDHPLSLGGLGLLGTAPAETAMEEADTLVMIGTNFPYAEYLPKPDQVRAIQIDIEPTHIGLRHPIDVGLVGDANATLQALLPHVNARGTSDWLEGLKGQMTDWWGLMQDRATRDETPLKPQVVAWELGKRLRDDAIVCGDSGTTTTWVARYIKMREGQRFTCSGRLATMAPSIPYANAAQCAYPDRQVIAVAGDGAALMLSGELSTAAMHDLPIKIIVFQNDTLGQIKWEQMVFLGNPSFGVDFPPVDFVKIAEGMGMKGFRVDRPEDVGGTLDAFLAHNGPALLEAVVDPNEPPHPSKVKLQQAQHMAKAMARGQPNAGRIGLTLFRDKVKDLIHPTGEEAEEAREAEPGVRRS